MPKTDRCSHPSYAAAVVAATLLVWTPAPGLADAGHGHGIAGGRPGEPGEVDRTVRVEAKDMRFYPDTVRVEDSETVRFVIHNADVVEHDFTIGTPEVQAQHRNEMEQMYASGTMGPETMHGGSGHGVMMQGGSHHQEMMSGSHQPMAGPMAQHGAGQPGSAAMVHDDPNAVFVQPGETKELIWRFDRVQNLQFACNVPGHSQAGMTGAFRFRQQ